MSAAILLATAAGPFGGPGWLAAAALAAIVILIALQSSESDAAGYAATMSLQVSHSLALVRFAVSDLFSAALIVRSGRDLLCGRERLTRSTLTVAFGCLIAAFAFATLVGYRRIGHLTSYVLLNRVAGILFLVAGFIATIQFLRTSQRVELLVRWFLDGVGIANAAALLASLTQLLGIHNFVYIAGSFRLNGWVGNPSLYGGILATAILLELGLMASVQGDRRRSQLRLLNLALLATSMLLTLSRSAWLCLAVGAVALRVSVAFEHGGVERRPSYKMMVNLWGLVPVLALGAILALNLGYGFESLTQRVASLNDSAAQQATIAASQSSSNPSPVPLDGFESLTQRVASLNDSAAQQATIAASQSSSNPSPVPLDGFESLTQRVASLNDSAAQQATIAASQSSSNPSPVPLDPMVVFRRDGTMMNARGLLDRVAIESYAWSEYTQSWPSLLLGVGLGTIFATSAQAFGYPIIVHNTFTWFLVELGPMGFACLVWVWAQTARNLWKAYRLADSRRSLVLGLIGAFGSMSVFMLLNEAFYHRHYWFLMILADRVAVLSHWSSTVEPEVGESQ